VSEDQLPALARRIEGVRAFAADLRGLDVAGVMPWTPPS